MFLPTKAHSREIAKTEQELENERYGADHLNAQGSQYKIRLGNRVPKDAVNLAYAHIPSVHSQENVLITDLSNTILENTRNAEPFDLLMFPDHSLLLQTESGIAELPTEDVLMTNIFQETTPLYYAHTLSYYHYDNRGPDKYGMYQGSGIVIVDRTGKPIIRPYKIQLIPTRYLNLYTVIIYTSFNDQESDSYAVVYNAVDYLPDGRTETKAGYIEKLNVSKAFQPVDHITSILTLAQHGVVYPSYYQGNGKNPAYSKFYVPTPPLIDQRRPQYFRYRIGVEITIKQDKYVFTTPWELSQVFHVDSLTEEEKAEYLNGSKQVTQETAERILRDYVEDSYFFHVYAKKRFFVLCDNDRVKTFTRIDGSSPVFARTDTLTDAEGQTFQIPYRAKRSQNPTSQEGLLIARVRPTKAPANVAAKISFIIDGSQSMKRHDEDGGFRQQLLSSILLSASEFYRKVDMNGYLYNRITTALLPLFTDQPMELITAFQTQRKDEDITNPLPAIEQAVSSLRELAETYNTPYKKIAILLTDGEYLDFKAVEDQISQAKAIGISLCVVTFNNYDRIKKICDAHQVMSINAKTAQAGLQLRYFFFYLAGLEDSTYLPLLTRFMMSPEDNEKPVYIDQYRPYIPDDIWEQRSRYTLEFLLKDPTGVTDLSSTAVLLALPEPRKMTFYLKDLPKRAILPAINGVDLLPLRYLETPDTYQGFLHCESYTYHFNHIYSLRFNDTHQIRVLNPIETERHQSWYLRVKNGRFERKVVVGEKVMTYVYSLPEYYTQRFLDMGAPYLRILDEKPKLLNDNQIQVLRTPLYVKVEDHHIVNITIMVNGRPIQVQTWDAFNGILTLNGTVTTNDDIRVSYDYREECYIYRGYYDEENEHFWNLDLNPSAGHFVTIRDRHDKEIKEVPSFALINETVYLYLKPTSKLMDVGDGEFRPVGDIQKATLFHTFEKIDGEALLMGEIHVRPNSNQASVRFIDTRVRGGGLKPEITQAIMREFEEESKFYWDIGHWDGTPYSENSVVIFRISRRVLKDYGGRFTKVEVEEKLNKYFAYGNLPIIEYIEDSDELLQIPEDLVVEVLEIQDRDELIVETPTFQLTLEG